MEEKKGITLIALVVTIIVLIILAGVSINLVLGQNGIINKAKQAKIENNHAKVYETLNSKGMEYWIERETEGKEGKLFQYLQENEIVDTEGIVNIKKLLGTTLSTGNGSVEEGDFYGLLPIEETDESATYLLVYIDKNHNETEIGPIAEKQSKDIPSGIYSEPGYEDKIAPQDLFDYEIISDGQVAATSMDSLPIKEARITGIKPQYCNDKGYNYKTGKYDVENTNYEIIYKENKISDLLVIPYQVEIDNQFYRITEVNLIVSSSSVDKNLGMLPKVETLVYPNTVKKIACGIGVRESEKSNPLKKVVLSNQLKEIPDFAFCGYSELASIKIPDGVERIGKATFYGCKQLIEITIPASVNNIEFEAGFFGTFDGTTNLANIKVDKNNKTYTSEDGVLYDKTKKTLIKYPSKKESSSYIIPDTVETIWERAFTYCNALKNINIRKEEGSIEGAPWGAPETTNINWNYTGE